MNCSVCGRKLRNPESQEVGYGPVCYKRMFGSKRRIRNTANALSTEAAMNYDVPGQMNLDDYLQMLQ